MLFRADVVNGEVTLFQKWGHADNDLYFSMTQDKNCVTWMRTLDAIHDIRSKRLNAVIATASTTGQDRTIYMIYVPNGEERARDFLDEVLKHEYEPIELSDMGPTDE